MVPYNVREEAISKAVAKQLFERRRDQAKAMKEGLETVISATVLQLLLPRDLQMMFAFDDGIDVQNWRQNTEYYKDYQDYRDANEGQDHPAIELFWKLMHEDPELAKKTFKWSTGYVHIPKGGYKGGLISKKYTIQYAADTNRFPSTGAWYITIDILFT